MTIIDTIKTDQLVARKAKDSVSATLLTTLIGEATQVGKNKGNRESTDAEVVAVIQKFIKNIDDTIRVISTNTDSVEKLILLNGEKAILTKYLPKQLTTDQLVCSIYQLIEQGIVTRELKSKGFLMKHFKDNYAGQYDGSALAVAVDEALKGKQ